MSLRINQNIEALTASRYLAHNDAMLSKSIEKLASGQKNQFSYGWSGFPSNFREFTVPN